MYPDFINDLPQPELDDLAKQELIDLILEKEGWTTTNDRQTKGCRSRYETLDKANIEYLSKIVSNYA